MAKGPCHIYVHACRSGFLSGHKYRYFQQLDFVLDAIVLTPSYFLLTGNPCATTYRLYNYLVTKCLTVIQFTDQAENAHYVLFELLFCGLV